MKIIISCVTLLVLAVFLTACGDGADASPQDEYVSAQTDTANEATNGTQDDSRQDENHGGGHEVENEAESNADEPAIAALSLGFAFEYRGTLIEMDQDMDYLLLQLGEPLGVFEAPSCAFDGIDRIFGFRGIQIHTYPDGDLDRVHTVSFLDDGVTTANGIRLGDTIADALAAYGGNYTQDTGMYTFTIERTTLSFFVEDDEVTSIIFGLIMD